MPTVYIPALLRSLTAGQAEVEAQGATVREVIETLDRSYPGLKSRLLDGEGLRANISVAIDGEIAPLGLLEAVRDNTEVHFVAAIKGGY